VSAAIVSHRDEPTARREAPPTLQQTAGTERSSKVLLTLGPS
jgi:hypothetical protein